MDVRSQPQHGWIEVITGSMFSGKSEELIRRLRRAQIARQRVQIFKPCIDNRYGDEHITSHSEMRIASTEVASSRALLACARTKPVVRMVMPSTACGTISEMPAPATLSQPPSAASIEAG